MKIWLNLQRFLILFVFISAIICSGCTDTTGSAGAVAVFDGNSRCRYCNEKITNDDIDTLKEQHGNGICAPEINFVDPSTHLCNYCGKPYVYNAQSSHGVGVCVYECAGTTGHRVPSAGNHTQCEICDGWLCVSDHGDGICSTLEPSPTPTTSPTTKTTLKPKPVTVIATTPAPTPTPTPIPTPSPTPSPTPTPVPVHSHSYVWKSTDDGHWQQCECGDETESAVHNESNNDGGCWSCSICGFKQHQNYTSTQIGSAEYHLTKCACGANSYNEEHWTGSNSCAACGYEVESTPSPTPTPHEHSYAWNRDNYVHWQECEGCGDRTDSVGHDTSGTDDACSKCHYNPQPTN